MFWLNLFSALTSVAGLIVSLYVLSVAKDARDAAEGARALARKRDLAEELGDASHKLQNVWNFLQNGQWIGVQIKTEEVLVICRTALSRWSDHLSDERKNGILQAINLIQSISAKVTEIAEREVEVAQPGENKKLASTYFKASGYINTALGEARREEERDGSNNGD
jgi:hypothetical protein